MKNNILHLIFLVFILIVPLARCQEAIGKEKLSSVKSLPLNQVPLKAGYHGSTDNRSNYRDWSIYQDTIITNNVKFNIASDSLGIYALDSKFNGDELIKKTSWNGDFIWLNRIVFPEFQNTKTWWHNNPDYKKQYKALFRKEFILDEITKEAILFITADISFRFYINGKFAGQGPSDIGKDYFDSIPPLHWFYSSYNIKDYLCKGENTIAVEVYSHYNSIYETSSGYGYLLCDLDAGENNTILNTNTGWKCNIDTSLTVIRRRFANDAKNEIENWSDKDFDDSGWHSSSVIDAAKDNYLIKNNIPVPLRYPIDPVEIYSNDSKLYQDNEKFVLFNKKLNSANFTLDYGRNITGFYGFEIIAHENDTIIIYPYEKKYTSLNNSITYICKEGINVFYAPFLSVFRYLRVRIISEKGMVINDIKTNFSSYPVCYTGSFECSDASLTQLWDITRNTTQLCMYDLFFDSPKHQEPIACTGDYMIQALINYYAFGDKWLARQTLLKTALMLEKNNYDMFHTSYSLLWVQMLKNYFDYTGDTTFVKELLPYVNKLNKLFESYLDNGYLVSNPPDFMFMDWIKIGEYDAHHPPAVIGMGYMTALYYKSLLDAAFLNKLASLDKINKENLELADKIKIAMNTLLWDKEKNLFKDGIPFRSKSIPYSLLPDDKDIVTYSPHVNTLSVLYNIAPKNHQNSLMNYVITQDSIDIQPFFMFFVLSAISHVEQFSTTGLELLKKWENGIDLETYTLKENWQDTTETGYKGDYSHAWGGSPLYFTSKHILGIQPGTAGYKEIRIKPFINDKITWAKGHVPIPNGKNQSTWISWIRKNNSKYTYKIDIPAGYVACFEIPEIWGKEKITVNNKKYRGNKKYVNLLSGEYTLVFGE
jgi:alpha-L-rhamnosidase